MNIFTRLLSLALLLSIWTSSKGQVFFINENFNGTTGNTPPAGWSNNTLVGASYDTWRFNNPGGQTLTSPITSPAAIFDSDDYSSGGGAEDVTLETPAFNTTGYAAVTLKFDHQFESGFGGRGSVEVWDGASWVQVYNTTAQVNTRTESINISSLAANKTGVKVRFRWRGDYSWWWIVDNVQIFYIVDVQAGSIDAPSTPCGATQDSVKVTVVNNSAFTVKDVPVAVELSGILTATQRDTIDSIPALGKVQIAFPGGNTMAGGTLNMKAYTYLAADNTKSNDSTSSSLNIIGTPNKPTVTGGANCGAGKVTLGANTALPSDSIVWFATNPASGLPIGLDRTFETPLLTNTTTFYAGAVRGDVTPKQLQTIYTSGNGNTGTMFDLKPQKNIVVDSLSFYEFTSVAGTYVIRIYYKEGTYNGFNANPGAWTQLGDYNVVSAGANVPLAFDVDDLPLAGGKTYGMYLTIISGPQTTVAYTNGANVYSNADLTIETGIGTGALFPTTFNNPRTWNGTVHYKLPGCISELVAVDAVINPVAEGTTLNAKAGSKGTFNGGTAVSADVTASPDSIIYTIVTPTGFNDADYGNSGTWVISSVNVATVNGTSVPSSMYTVKDPSSIASGEFMLHTDTTFNDSTILVEMNVRRLDNGCDTLLKKYIYVAPRPIARFNANAVCLGDITEFVNSTYIQAGALTYEWDFGNGTTSDLGSPFVTFTSAGTYTITLKVESEKGYRDSITQTIDVKNVPEANFEFENKCEGTPLVFRDLSVKPAGTPIYTWVYGDGTTGNGATSTHLYATPNIYQAKLIVEVNGCSDEVSRYVTQAPRAVPDFSFLALQCDNADVTFSNNSTAPSFGTASYTWNLGDGTIQNSTNFTHTYNNFQTYDVKLYSSTNLGCVDSISKSVTLTESPKSDFNVVGSQCSGDVLTFDNTTTVPGGTNSYEWDFGDANASTDMSPMHQFAGPGVKNVTLTSRNTNGCESMITKQVMVELKPNADFTTNGDVCLGVESQFTNNSNIGDNTMLAYAWDVDGTASANLNEATTFTTTGTKTITLIATSVNGCTDTSSATLEVNPVPVAQANIASQQSFDGSFSFATNTTGASYKWLFGDGGSANTQNALYTYPIDGKYVVTLIVVSDKGCVGVDRDTLSVFRLGVEENALSNNVKVYPNPGSGIFDIEFDGINTNDVKSVVVLNNLGQKVAVLDTRSINNNKLAVNIAEQAAGVYFIQVETAEGKASFKYNLVK